MTLLALLVCLGIPLALAWSFARFRVEWSKRKVVLWSAGPVPAIAAVPCLLVIVNAMTTPAENCGVDACGMAIAAGLAMLGMAGAIFVVGALIALGTVVVVRRGAPAKADVDVFE